MSTKITNSDAVSSSIFCCIFFIFIFIFMLFQYKKKSHTLQPTQAMLLKCPLTHFHISVISCIIYIYKTFHNKGIPKIKKIKFKCADISI